MPVKDNCSRQEPAVLRVLSRSMSGARRHTRGSTRNAQDRKTVLDLDLNQPASVEGRTEVNASMVGRALPPVFYRGPDAPIDVEVIEDDVVISSPRSFAEAMNMSRHSRGMVVLLDEDPGLRPSHSEAAGNRPRRDGNRNRKRTATNQVVIDCDDENDDGTSTSKRKKVENADSHPADATSKEMTFKCAVCMSTLVEPMSTICGHIFCKVCIKTSINVQKKCPTCRRKLTLNNIHRIYLPHASSG